MNELNEEYLIDLVLKIIQNYDEKFIVCHATKSSIIFIEKNGLKKLEIDIECKQNFFGFSKTILTIFFQNHGDKSFQLKTKDKNLIKIFQLEIDKINKIEEQKNYINQSKILKYYLN